MIKKIFIIFTFGLIIFFNGTKVQAKETNNLDTTQIIEYIEEYDCKIKVIPITKFQEDEISRDYYSITYQVTTENCNLDGCYIPWTIGLPYRFIITDQEEVEDKREFIDKFKIMIPKEKQEFSGKIEIIVKFKLNGGEQLYQIDRFIEFDSRKSSLEIEVVDNENNKPIKGVEIDLENCEFFTNEKYISNEKGKIFVDRIGVGESIIQVINVPEEYNKLEAQNIKIRYDRDEKYILKLEHKKGNFIINNLPKATFEIYDMEENLVGEYQTDEEGIIEIKGLNTGKYRLKQTKTPSGYEQIADMNFEIKENETFKLGILNIKLPGEQKPNDNIEKDKNDKVEEKPKDEIPSDKEENDKEAPVKKPENNIQKEDNKKDETIKDKVEVNKPEEKTEEEKKAGNEKVIEKEENTIITNPVVEKNITAITNPKQNQSNIRKLPRTGSDYFEIKLIIFELVVFIAYILVLSLKKKRQTIKNSLSNNKVIK